MWLSAQRNTSEAATPTEPGATAATAPSRERAASLAPNAPRRAALQSPADTPTVSGLRPIAWGRAAHRAALGGQYASIDDVALELDSGRLELLRELIEAGHVRPVVDRCYPFEQLVEAHEYVAHGHKAGGVAIRV